jgi:ATP-dependent DNA helicase RecQ
MSDETAIAGSTLHIVPSEVWPYDASLGDTHLAVAPSPVGLDECWALDVYSRPPHGMTTVAQRFTQAKFGGFGPPAASLRRAVADAAHVINGFRRWPTDLVVVPLPSSARLVSSIAESVSRRLAVPLVDAFQPSIGPQLKQTPLEARPGLAQLRLRLKPGFRGRASVLLIDDVVESGATLSTAARLLRDSGATHVIAVTAVHLHSAARPSVSHPRRTVEVMDDPLLDALRTLTGRTDAQFHPDQREAIEALVVSRGRVLLVQRTGWGKSAVYFLATHLLRQQGLGPTLLVSPLLALIRNQIEAASRLGLRTMSVNSSSATTVDELRRAVEADQVDLVLISPERLANPEFGDKVMPIIGRRPGLMVIDEAHCISDWGHDFRPDYRRLSQVITGLGQGIPVLACTATANDRVVADVADQLGVVEFVVRGPLRRDGLALHVVDIPSAAQRLAWLHTVLPSLAGTGIVYCLTVRDVERVTDWLKLHDHDVVSYTGQSDDDDRLDIEDKLKHNEVKAVVATSALGMGYDKPDLGFVIHFQAPGSPVAYYQQVGRAGRQLDHSVGVLLRGAEDRDIQDWFIATAFPAENEVDEVLDVFAHAMGPVTLSSVLHDVNMKRGDVELVLKQLTVEGVLRRQSGNTYERTLKPWSYPAARVAAVTAARRREQEQMDGYGDSGECRMGFLTALLDDPNTDACGVCDVCSGQRFQANLDPQVVEEAQRFLRHGFVLIEPRKVRGGHRLPEELQLEHGRALCVWNEEGWGKLVVNGKHEGRFDDRLVEAFAAMLKDWSPEPAAQWLTFVPSLRRPGLIADFAARLGRRLRLRVLPLIAKVHETPPQKQQRNGPHQELNIRGAFALTATPPSSPGILLDDLVDSRWTMTEIGLLLREHGAGPMYPVALGSLQGRDS